jgi:hypothetical protein
MPLDFRSQSQMQRQGLSRQAWQSPGLCRPEFAVAVGTLNASSRALHEWVTTSRNGGPQRLHQSRLRTRCPRCGAIRVDRRLMSCPFLARPQYRQKPGTTSGVRGSYRPLWLKLWAIVLNVDQYSLECGQDWSTQEHLAPPLRSPEFFSVFMSGNKFVFLLRKLSGCDSISSGVKEGVRESQRIGWYGKPYVRKRPAAQLGARL